MGAQMKPGGELQEIAWRGFAPGKWRSQVNVREFTAQLHTLRRGWLLSAGRDAADDGHMAEIAAAA